MRYRTLGRTGLQVSEIGFGCGNVGGLLIRGKPQEQLEAVSHAIELGINYFDTAPQYGNGQSETNLGLVLRQLRPDVRVATKVGITPDDLKDLKGAIQSSVETSLRRLGRERLDVLQLHTPIAEDRAGGGRWRSLGVSDVLGKSGVADVFDAVRSQGLVGYLGFTGLGDTEALHQVVGSRRFDVVQTYYNLLNPSAGVKVPAGFAGQDFRQLIDVASRQGMGIVVIRVMAGGALGGRIARSGYASPSIGGALVPSSEYDKDEARATKLNFLVEGDVHSLPQATVRFALMNPNVSTVLVGYSSISQIDEAAECSEKAAISPTSMARLNALWASDFTKG